MTEPAAAPVGPPRRRTLRRPAARFLIAVAAAYASFWALQAWAVPPVTPVAAPLTPADVLTEPLAGGQPLVVRDGDAAMMCSLGVPWQSADGDDAWVTAGHCGAPESGAYRSPRGSRGDELGTFAGQEQPSIDAALVLPGAHLTQSAPPTILGRYPVRAAANPRPGDSVCLAGVSTGTSCGWRVWVTDRVFSVEGGKTVRAAAVVGRADRCVTQGDSGGPVFTLEDGHAVVFGVVTATAETAGVPGLSAGSCATLFTPVAVIAEAVGGRPRTLDADPAARK